MDDKEQASKQSLIEPADTTKEGIRAYLEDAAATVKAEVQSGASMRLAVFRFLMDTAKIRDKEVRNQAWKQFDATPGWFGCNASAARQALKLQSREEKIFNEFDA